MPGTQKKAEPKTPHFLSLNQDIVASPQDEKCGLKYVMLTHIEVIEGGSRLLAEGVSPSLVLFTLKLWAIFLKFLYISNSSLQFIVQVTDTENRLHPEGNFS